MGYYSITPAARSNIHRVETAHSQCHFPFAKPIRTSGFRSGGSDSLIQDLYFSILSSLLETVPSNIIHGFFHQANLI